MKSIERNCWKNYHSIENNQLIDSILYFCAVTPDGITALYYSTEKRVNIPIVFSL